MLGLGSASGKVLSNSIAFLDVTALSQDNTQLRMHLSVSIHHENLKVFLQCNSGQSGSTLVILNG